MDRVNCEVVEENLVALTLNPRELSERERADILAQLDGCDSSRELYQDYLRISDGLLNALPQRVPPPALKAALMARVKETTLQPEKTANWLERFAQWLTGNMGIPRLAVGAAAALLVGSVGVSGNQAAVLSRQTALQGSQLVLAATREADQQKAFSELATRTTANSTQQTQLLDILSDTDAHSISLGGQDVAPKARAKMQFNPTHNTAVLSLNDLPAITPEQIYQLWFFDDAGKPLPSITFDAAAKNVLVNADSQFGAFKNFAITIEPAGGSVAPRGPLALLGLP